MTLRLLFVGEGHRDGSAVPALVGNLLSAVVEPQFEAWPRLGDRGAGRGFGRKLKFAVRQAIDACLAGVVATVDADKRPKLADLTTARAEDRAKSVNLPTVVGEAIPHLEAWLLDDPVAVRESLALASVTEIPAPTKSASPKDDLNRLWQSSGGEKTSLQNLIDIAASLSCQRCIHAAATGFERFRVDVEHELRPLTQK